eukprot:291588_1
MAMLFALLIVCYISHVNSIRVPLIIDTDIGSDFDDCFAVSYALSRNDIFDIKLILTATYNTTGRAQLVAKFLDAINRTEVDIGIGINTKIPINIPLYDGVGPQMPWAIDFNLNHYSGNIYSDGINRAKYILKTMGTSQNPVYVVGIAPFSNLAQIFIDEPELKRNMRLITMSGSLYSGYGKAHAQPEYNVRENISAAQIVYNYTDKISYAMPICVAPLDTTWWFQIYGENYQKLLNSQQILPKTIIENYSVWYENGGKNLGANRAFNPIIATSTDYDTQAMFQASIIAMNSTNNKQTECNNIPFMSIQASQIVVNESGYTVNDTNTNSEIQIVYETVGWNNGNYNGTYSLGEYVINWLTIM